MMLLSCNVNKNTNSKAFSSKDVDLYYQEKFQRTADEYIKAGIIDFSKEALNSIDLLNRNNIGDFSKQIARYKISKAEKDFVKDIFISEDKTTKLWFVAIQLRGAAFDNILYMIIVKNNCKVIYLSRYMN